MPTFKSLEDLKSLLSEEKQRDAGESVPQPRMGYDGRPQVLQVALDTRRRRGKVVTLVTGFQCSSGELKEMARDLKKICGAGGKAADDSIEIQGDHREKVLAELKKLGFEITD